MVEYSVTDIVKEICRKWYIVILGIAIFAGISYPISRSSFSNAQEDYRSALEGDADEEEEEGFSGSLFYQVKEGTSAELRIYTDCILNHKFMNDFTPKYSFDYEKVSGQFALGVVSEDMIRVDLSNIKEGDYEKLKVILQDVAKDLNGRGLEISLEEDLLLQYSLEDENIYETLYEEPSGQRGAVRTMGTAAVLGCVVSMFGIMLLDYRKKAKELIKSAK